MHPWTSKIVALLKPKRRWFRFSLGTMLIVMVLCAAWMGLHVNSIRLQRQSVAAINEYGGSVRYDFHYPNGKFGPNDVNYQATSPVPKWLLDLVGVDFFHDVVAVNVRRSYGYSRQYPDADDGLLRRLRGFPELRSLELSHCGITDNGLRHLPDFPLLQTLELSYASVTDDGMPHIGRLQSLRDLDLAHTRVNGRGFHRLARLEHLEFLDLALTPIRDEALSKIQGMEGLEYVSVWGCRHLTREGVASFRQKVPNCRVSGLGRRRL